MQIHGCGRDYHLLLLLYLYGFDVPMLKEIKKVLARYNSAVKNFYEVSRLRFLYSVILGFFIECLQLIVFIVPIKILILVGGDSIPGYLSRVPLTATKIEWISFFTLLVVGAYVLGILLQRLLKSSSRLYVANFVEANRKGSWSDEKFIEEVYSRFVQARSKGFLAILMLAIIVYLYADLAGFVASITLLGVLILLAACSFSNGFAENLRDDTAKYTRVAYAPIFLLAFCYIVVDYLIDLDPPSLISAIISLILIRQLLAIVTQKVMDVIWFRKKEFKIQKLFFRGYEIAEKRKNKTADVWSFLANGGISDFSHDIASALGFRDFRVVECRWVECEVPLFHLVEVKLSSGNVDTVDTLLLKVYEKQKSRFADRDEMLYPVLRDAGLLPEILGCITLNGFFVHAFILSNDCKFSNKESELRLILLKLFSLRLEEGFVEEYVGEHPTLWDRINSNLLDRMRLVANSSDNIAITEFIDCLPELFVELQSLPLSLVTSLKTLEASIISDQNKPMLVTLGNWSIEPLGVGISVNQTVLASLTESRHAEAISDFEERLRILSKLALVESSCSQGRLTSAIKHMKALINDDFFSSCMANKSVEKFVGRDIYDVT